MGRSRGGLTTKIHALVDAEGRPVRMELAKRPMHQSPRGCCPIFTMEIIKESGRTDAAVNSLSDADLCRELGGIWVLADKRCD